MTTAAYALLPLCYLVGAIPTGLLMARAFGGINILEHGSKNIGATNVWRVLGWKAGLTTFIIDVGKACAVLALIDRAMPDAAVGPVPFAIICAFAVYMGNFANIFLGGKGGKGIATGLGVSLALATYASLSAFSIFLIVFAITRYVSLGSIAAAAALPFLTWYFAAPDKLAMVYVNGAASAFAIFKHRANMVRLWNGTESRFGKKKAE